MKGRRSFLKMLSMAAVSTALPSTNGVLINTNTDSGSIMKVQGEEKFRITSSGRIGIGTKSPKHLDICPTK